MINSESINQSVFGELVNIIFNIYTNPLALKITDNLSKKNATFNDYLKFSRGVEFGFKSNKVFDEKIDAKSAPILCGSNISKHNIIFENKYINHNPNDASIYKKVSIYDDEKILIKRIGNSIIGAYDNNGFYNVCDVYNLQLKIKGNYNLSVISLIINSKLLNFFYDTKFKSVKKLFPKIPIQNLKLLPLPKYNKKVQQPFIEKADTMLSLNKDLQETSQKFQRTIQRKFELEKLPKKLQEWYKLTYSEFVKELAKKKIKLSLSQEAAWEDYFISEQQKAVALKTQIDQTDKEIDQMVYELYGLTDDEIMIVEQS
ncbi:MAG: hypothetical protein L3J14_02705 [Flavobacteriaceae bacterium]|nr:hypothetical protein [Flavobacteriaceae bacterium]